MRTLQNMQEDRVTYRRLDMGWQQFQAIPNHFQ
jgi:hypothetical protein